MYAWTNGTETISIEIPIVITVLFGIVGWFLRDKFSHLDRQTERQDEILNRQNQILDKHTESLGEQSKALAILVESQHDWADRVNAVETAVSKNTDSLSMLARTTDVLAATIKNWEIFQRGIRHGGE